MPAALGFGVLLLVILAALLRSGIALGAAYALTTFVSLPGAVKVLAWIAAGGFVALQLLAAFVAIAALVTASKTQSGIRPARRKRR